MWLRKYAHAAALITLFHIAFKFILTKALCVKSLSVDLPAAGLSLTGSLMPHVRAPAILAPRLLPSLTVSGHHSYGRFANRVPKFV